MELHLGNAFITYLRQHLTGCEVERWDHQGGDVPDCITIYPSGLDGSHLLRNQLCRVWLREDCVMAQAAVNGAGAWLWLEWCDPELLDQLVSFVRLCFPRHQ